MLADVPVCQRDTKDKDDCQMGRLPAGNRSYLKSNQSSVWSTYPDVNSNPVNRCVMIGPAHDGTRAGILS